MAGEAVAAAGGDHAEGGVGADQHAADAVDHAVAARDENRVDAGAHRVFGLVPTVVDIVAELIGHVDVAPAPVLFDEFP